MSWTSFIPQEDSSKPTSQDWLWTVQKLFVISLPPNPLASLKSVKQSHSLSSQPRVSFCYFCLPTNNCCDILTIIIMVSYCICQYIATKQSYMPLHLIGITYFCYLTYVKYNPLPPQRTTKKTPLILSCVFWYPENMT